MTGTTAAQALRYGLFTEKCFEEFFVANNFFHLPCLKLLLSKLLSYVVLLGALVVKVPQIIKILKSGSAGLAPSMFVLESVGYAISAAFSFRRGYAFSTYGEGAFVVAQNLVILLLIARGSKGGVSAGFLASFAVGVAAGLSLFTDVVPAEVLTTLQLGIIPLSCSSRLPQIWANFRNKTTGSLSLITVFMQFAGSSARIFTTLQEVNDLNVLLPFVVGATLNGIMLAQILFYWKSPAPGAKGTKSAKTKKTE